MDRLIFTALNTIQYAQEDNVIRSNNLANATVPGFRRDIEPKEVGTGFLAAIEEFETRAFSIRAGMNRFSREAGHLDYTEQPTDISVSGPGFFIIEPVSGQGAALSRRGDFRINTDGQLIDGAGNILLNDGLQPIVLPPHRELVVGDDGLVSIEPLEGEPGVLEEIGQIGTTLAVNADLKKFPDGHIRLRDGGIPEIDQETRMVQGYLEGSNVNTVQELIENMQRQRTFELNVRMISVAKEIDEAGTSVLRMPN